MTTIIKENILRNCLPKKVYQYRQLIEDGTPYVWKLRLSYAEFCQLEEAINESIHLHGEDHNHLLCEEYAPLVVMYLAEWYKRFYKGVEITDNHKALSLTTEELKNLYQLAKIDANTFVYNASKNPDKTSFRWLECLQVLGGLAVQVELKRDDDDGLLSQLCKIFHGEDIELDNLKDRNRAVAFQESIARRHSLYDFLDCILDKQKEMPFAQEDMKDETTSIPLLVDRILSADREAKKNKFDFEWIISYLGNSNQMIRTLKVKLKPEVIGGGQKQYIGYDRLMTSEWGVEHPEDIGRLEFFVRFKNGKKIIGESAEPLFKYHNTGSETTGFLSVGKLDETIYSNVPATFFDKVEIVLVYDQVQKVVQSMTVEDYIQVYALKGSSNKFSSKKNTQATTVVIFSSAYRLAEEYQSIPVDYARFKYKEEESDNYYWCPISDKVILVGPDNKELQPPFFNRNGLYQVVTKKYLRTIKYEDNTFVLFRYIDSDYDDEEMVNDQIRALFGRQGLEVRHYKSSQSKECTAVTDYDVEWMKGGRYIDWNIEEPPQGRIRLRVTVKGIVFKLQVYYVPFISSESIKEPIWRDFEHHRICTALEGVNDIEDHFSKDINYRESDTRTLEIGNDTSKICVDVYRPIILRELSQGGHIVRYFGKDEDVEVPLINARQFSIRDFSENGVKEYSLNATNSAFYGFTTFNEPNLSADNYCEKQKASNILTDIPLDYLKIYISKPLDHAKDLWAWNYKTAPEKVENASQYTQEGIIFQSLKDNNSPLEYAMPVIKRGRGSWGGRRNQTEANVLECFKTVCLHKTYFFLFNPLLKCVYERRQIQDLLIPILAKESVNENEASSLFLFATQFHFDWMLLPRDSWKKEIIQAVADEAEQRIIADRLIQFFRLTSKITDERERYCLDEFLQNYWSFNAWPKIDIIGHTALDLIMGNMDSLNQYGSMKHFLKAFDECRFKFSEMSKVVFDNKKED